MYVKNAEKGYDEVNQFESKIVKIVATIVYYSMPNVLAAYIV